MACYSTIKTKLVDADRLIDALEQSGYKIERTTSEAGTWSILGRTADRTIRFSRSRISDPFGVAGDMQDLTGISRQYAEIGVRAWANRQGFSVTEKAGNKITLVNRRG